ncbi:MAG: 30S ribosomal protein S4e [Candidatus Njordarchaeia archaeon]
MTKHGQRKQLKRIATPKLYPVPKKTGGRFVIKPGPGPHPADRCIPLGVILREILGYARNMREIKKILSSRLVEVDGRVITNYKFPVGIMDVIRIKEDNVYFRVLPFKRKLVLYEISEEEAKFKLVKIINKKYTKGGNVQLNLFDGRNIQFKAKDDKERREIIQKYKIGDTLMITIPEQKIIEHYPLDIGSYIIITAGRHMGEHGKLKTIHKLFGAKSTTAEIELPTGATILTALEYAFVIGKDGPVMTLPTEKEVKEIAKRKPIRI